MVGSRARSRSRSRSAAEFSDGVDEVGSRSRRSRSRSEAEFSDDVEKTPQCIAWLDTWRQKIPAFASALDRYAAGLRRQLVVGTGCSGTGAPSHALDQLLPGRFVEVIASERHAPTREFFLANNWVEHCWSDIQGPRIGGFCATHGQHCDGVPPAGDAAHVALDLFVCGRVQIVFS
ncbi:unnamed protein product, partial [Durusdinium trenchii]